MEITDDNYLDVLAGAHHVAGGTVMFASPGGDASAHTHAHAAASDAPAPVHPRDDIEDETFRMVEREILNAQRALARQLAEREGEARERGKPSEAERQPTGSGLSSARRREILTQLAVERSGMRGFASDRERVHLQSQPTASAAAARPAGRDAVPGLVSEHALSSAVSSALDSALSRLGLQASVAPSTAVPALTATAPAAAPAAPPPVAAPAPPSALERIAHTHTHTDDTDRLRPAAQPPTNDKEALIARLLAERKAKLLGASSVAAPSEPPRAGPHMQVSRPTAVAAPTVASADGGAKSSSATLSTASQSAPSKPSVSDAAPDLLLRLRAEVAARMRAKGAATGADASPSQVRAPTTDGLHQAQARPAEQAPAPQQRPATSVRIPEWRAEETSAVPAGVTGTNGQSRASASGVQSSGTSAPAVPAPTAPSRTAAAPARDRKSTAVASPKPRTFTEAVSANVESQSAATSPVLSVSPAGSVPAGHTTFQHFKRRGREDLLEQREREAMKECTFKPSTTAYEGSRIPRRSSTSASRLRALSRSKAHAWALREKQRREMEDALVNESCTFQPNAAKPADERSVSAARRAAQAVARRVVKEHAVEQEAPNSNTSADVADAAEHMYAAAAASDGLSWQTSLARAYLEGPTAAPRTKAKRAPEAVPSEGDPDRHAASAVPTSSQKRGVPPRQDPPKASYATEVRPPVKRRGSADNVASRLYAEADARQLARAKARAEQERQQLAQCTFRPALSGRHGDGADADGSRAVASMVKSLTGPSGAGSVSAGSPGRKPLHERSEEIQRARAANLARLRMQAAMADPDLTFKPRINEVSEKIATQRMKAAGLPVGGEPRDTDGHPAGTAAAHIHPEADDGAGSVHTHDSKARPLTAAVAATERLSREAAEVAARRAARLEAAAREEAARFSFAPRINPTSAKIVEERLGTAAEDPVERFFERQHVYEEIHRQHTEARKAAAKAADGCTFKPDIGNADDVLAHARPELITESDADRVARLSKRDAAARERSRERVKEEYYGQFSFKPAINEASRHLGRAHTVEEHVRNDEGKRAILKAAAHAEREFYEKHPFRPQLVAKDVLKDTDPAEGPVRIAAATDPDHVAERIAEIQRRRAEKLEAARKRKEYEELQACTFQPATNTDAVPATSTGDVVVVRGLGRFLELKELSKQMEEDQREREAAAFQVRGLKRYDEGGAIPRGPTIPEPFHLTTAERQAARAQASPTRPDTTQQHAREAMVSRTRMLRELLNSDV